MAVSTEAINLVKQKARISLDGIDAGPGAKAAFKAFWFWMATHKGNPDLVHAAFADLTTDAVVEDEACTLYAVYLKKQTSSTAAYYKIFNDATDDSTAADAVACVPLITSDYETFLIFPKGVSLSAGLVHGSYVAGDDYNGTTQSTSGDGPDGFVIYGA